MQGILAKEFQPTFDVQDLLNLPNCHVYLKLMIGGTPSGAFSAKCFDGQKYAHGAREEVLLDSKAFETKSVVESDFF